MSTIIGTDINELPSRLAAIPAGETVNLALVTDKPVDQGALDDLTSKMREAGIKMFSPAAYVSLDWEGYTRSAAFVSFENPVTPADGEYGLLPVLLLGIVGVGALGYILWKGGDIATTFMENVSKMIVPLTLIGVATFLVYTVVKKPQGG